MKNYTIIGWGTGEAGGLKNYFGQFLTIEYEDGSQERVIASKLK